LRLAPFFFLCVFITWEKEKSGFSRSSLLI